MKNLDIIKNAPILEWDEDHSLESKAYFFGNGKKSFEDFKNVQALGIDKIMIPQQSSHTMTTSSNNNGRPSKEDSDNVDSVAKTPEAQ